MLFFFYCLKMHMQRTSRRQHYRNIVFNTNGIIRGEKHEINRNVCVILYMAVAEKIHIMEEILGLIFFLMLS